MRRNISGYSRKFLAPVLLAVILALTACVSSKTPVSSPTTVPPEVTQYARDWPLPNRDYSNTRATKDSLVNSANVNTLGVAWVAPITGVGLFGSASTTPIIMGNTVYFQDLGNNIFALDLSNGAKKWQKIYSEANVGPNGVAVGWGKVFAATTPYNFSALDMNSGNELWSTQVSNMLTVGNDIQPTVYDGLVYTSTVPGSSGSNFYSGGGIGTLYALDQKTGKIIWSFDTVDSKDLWGNKAINSGGGGWYSPSVDTKTGIMYWGIANPAPWPGTKEFPNGSSRPGPNLYTNSLTALDSKNGKLQWFNQVAPHDIFDYDFQVEPILASATINGKKQEIVIGAGKMGKVVAFNREKGTTLWTVAVGKHENDQLTSIPSDTTVTVIPGYLGGVETPMAYADGVVYVPVVNLAVDYTSSTAKGHPFSEGTGELAAIDVNTGKILWQKQFNSMNFGGATVVNDLVFTATFDGTIYAFKRDTGAQVWSYKAPGGINAWPAVAGGTIIYPVGLGDVPALVALRLGAKTPVVAMTPADGATVPAGDVKVSTLAFNLSLVDKKGQTNVPGEGHIHYFIDADAPTEPGKPAVTAAGTYAASSATSYTWPNVAPGTHTLSVELVNNDHTPLNPPVVARVTVKVQVPSPDIKIVFPQDRAALPPGDVAVSVKVSNFKLVDKKGQTSVPGEGHIHYFIDVDAPTEPGKPAVTAAGTYAASSATSYTWPNVAPGTHTLSVELINNDHTPLSTPVVAKVTIVISATGQGGP